MDKKTFTALKHETFPKITFELTGINDLQLKDGQYTISAVGDLTIAGTTQSVDLLVGGNVYPDGSLQFYGTYDMLMTTFNISPPTAMFGSLKTGDAISLKFDLTLVEQSADNRPLK